MGGKKWLGGQLGGEGDVVLRLKGHAGDDLEAGEFGFGIQLLFYLFWCLSEAESDSDQTMRLAGKLR